MLELIKNIGLGLFVNGSFALQMGQNELGSWVSLCEGLFLMASSIYLQRREKWVGKISF